jgi:hypothetical protein
MGEQFILQKSGAARRRREATFEQELATDTLFSACPETFITVYRCRCTRDDVEIVVGAPLLIMDDGGKTLSVLQHNIRIGYVLVGDSGELRRALVAEGRLSGLCYAKVAEAMSLDRTFTVALWPVGGKEP